MALRPRLATGLPFRVPPCYATHDKMYSFIYDKLHTKTLRFTAALRAGDHLSGKTRAAGSFQVSLAWKRGDVFDGFDPPAG